MSAIPAFDLKSYRELTTDAAIYSVPDPSSNTLVMGGSGHGELAGQAKQVFADRLSLSIHGVYRSIFDENRLLRLTACTLSGVYMNCITWVTGV